MSGLGDATAGVVAGGAVTLRGTMENLKAVLDRIR
jgi:hypothetical protein